MSQQVWLVRHGETEWSASGRHTSRTDLPLTDAGATAARRLGATLVGVDFARVLTSPLVRARRTCELAGLGGRAEVVDDLREWDYGSYEGRTTAEIRQERPDWSLWADGAPGGEAPPDVAIRADRVVSAVRGASGDVAVFAHGHILRVLAARWVGCGAEAGRLFSLATGTVSVLGYERDVAVIARWNQPVSA